MLRYQLITLLAALLTASGATSTPRDVKARAQARERVAPRTAIASCGSLGNNEVTFSVNSVDFISQIFLIPVGISEQQIHFTVTNTASTVSTDCILSNFMLDDHWSDQGTTWHSCLNQTITADDNETYTVLTSTLFDWTQFIATVNQTWACKGESALSSIYGTFSAELVPTCQYIVNDFVNITECSAADVSATGTATILG